MKPSRRLSSQRGSLLIVAMLICAIIGISLVSYINVGRSALKTSNRNLYNNAAMNLAENGLEEAMYSINKLVNDPTYSFSTDGWTPVGANDMKRKWTSASDSTLQFEQNATGEVRVYIYNYNGGGGTPAIVARSLVTLKGDTTKSTVEKWVRVTLKKTSKFANGLVAKDTIRFSGNNASVDSWNSDPDNNSATAAIPYSAGVRHDNGSVGSISVSVNSVLVQNADIWGYAATGGALPTVGSNGLVGPFGTTAGTMDMSRVSTDFSANFDPVTMPATGASIGSITSTTTLGTAGATQTITCSTIDLTSSEKLNIVGNVTLLVTAPAGTNAIDMTGNAEINIASGSSLKIYTAGDIKIAGNGVANGGTTTATANQPINFQIWGTKTSGVQDIQIAGNGVLSSVVYAPQGSVKINGNGDVMGSVVANDITVVGNAAFHYDESLGNFGGNNPYRVTRWDEINKATDRATYASVMTW